MFAKACESAFQTEGNWRGATLTTLPVFIAEITARAFIVADADKRRTLSRSDIAKVRCIVALSLPLKARRADIGFRVTRR